VSTSPFFSASWDWSPQALVLVFGVLTGYYLLFREKLPRGSQWFLAGLFLLFVTLDSPLGPLSDVLFCAHMVKHLLLLLAIPPLLYFGIQAEKPSGDGDQTDARPRDGFFPAAFFWLAGVGGMWIWHIPALCDAAERNGGLRSVETISTLLLGICFWWPILGPRLGRRLEPLSGVLYLFSACVGCTLLGIFITFAPDGLYPAYCHPIDPLGIQPWARDGFGLTASADRQIGGLIMWVPACFVYLSGSLGLLFRWYHSAPPARPGSVAEGPEETPPLPGAVHPLKHKRV
jgi:putative membrane protein